MLYNKNLPLCRHEDFDDMLDQPCNRTQMYNLNRKDNAKDQLADVRNEQQNSDGHYVRKVIMLPKGPVGIKIIQNKNSLT